MLWLEEQPWMGKSWLVPIVRLYCAVCKEDYVWWTILSSFQTSDMFLVFCCINAVLEVHINNIDNCMFHIPYHNLFFPALKYILFLFVWLLGFSNILTDKLTCSDTFSFPFNVDNQIQWNLKTTAVLLCYHFCQFSYLSCLHNTSLGKYLALQ